MYQNMTANLMVEQVERTIAFYRDILGFSAVVTVPGKNGGFQFAILAKDGLSLMLQERTNLTEEYPILRTERVQPSATLYITVDHFDDLYGAVKEKHPIYTGIHTSFYGAREFAILDPDGYVLTFSEQRE